MCEKIINICSFDGCDLYVENIIIHVLIMLHVVLILHVTCYSMKWHNCISYDGDIMSSRVCVHGIGYSPFLVNV